MYPGKCDTNVFSQFQNQIPIDGGSIYLYQIPKAVVQAPVHNAMGLIVPKALANHTQAWTAGPISAAPATTAIPSSDETLMGVDQKGNTCFEFIGPQGANPIMLNTHDQHMYSGKCDRSVFSVFQDKIPSQGGYFMLYQIPKPSTIMIMLI